MVLRGPTPIFSRNVFCSDFRFDIVLAGVSIYALISFISPFVFCELLGSAEFFIVFFIVKLIMPKVNLAFFFLSF